MSMFGAAVDAIDIDCILNCDRESISVSLPTAEAYLHLPIVVSMKWKETLILFIYFLNDFCTHFSF